MVCHPHHSNAFANGVLGPEKTSSINGWVESISGLSPDSMGEGGTIGLTPVYLALMPPIFDDLGSLTLESLDWY